jgi:ferritin-like metal-binding protein YciE
MADRERQDKIGHQKIVQYLGEAHAMEWAMVQTLGAHISITPRGAYRTELERHLDQTRRHAGRIERRLDKLGEGRNPLQVGFAAAQATLGQAIATAKAPVDVFRGASRAERLLKNAKDEAVSEQLEIVTYRALQRLAEAVNDDQTARLAASIRQDEMDMQTRLHEHVEVLTEAVVNEEVRQQKVFDLTTVGAVDRLRRLAGRATGGAQAGGRQARMEARRPKRRVKSSGRKVAGRARRTTGVAPSPARRKTRTATSGVPPTAAAATKGTDAAGRRTKRAAGTPAAQGERRAGLRRLDDVLPALEELNLREAGQISTDLKEKLVHEGIPIQGNSMMALISLVRGSQEPFLLQERRTGRLSRRRTFAPTDEELASVISRRYQR